MVGNLTLSNKIDIMCLEKTKLNNPSPRQTQDLSPNKNFVYITKNAKVASGGKVDGSKLKVLESAEGEYNPYVSMKRKVDGWRQIVTVVYNLYDSHQRPQFGREIDDLESIISTPWVIGGFQ